MNVSLYQAAAAMNAHALSQEVIAGNMAASNIPGFKKHELSFSAVEAARNGGAISVPKANVITNFKQGELRRTGVQTDLGLQGAGFFEVQLPSGETVYTRDGEFKLDGSGQLVTKQGHLVLSDAGIIQFDRNSSAPIHITAEGEVSQGSVSKGKLRIVQFPDPAVLRQMSAGLFAAPDATVQPEDAIGTKVQQGFLEAANTNAASEMTNLIAVMRAFEANQRIVQMQDERLGRVISELGNPN